MAFIYIGGNEWINNSLAAKVTVEVEFNEKANTRTRTTRIYDVTGLHVIFELKTKVYTHEYEKRQFDMVFDNEKHHQIIVALKEGKDALEYEDLVKRVNELMAQENNLKEVK